MQINNNCSVREIGRVVSAQDYLINLEGLPSARINDIIVNKNGARAIVHALYKERLQALMLDTEQARPGDYFTYGKNRLTLPLHTNILSRAFNPLGIPFDGKGALPPGGENIDLDINAPGIDKRAIIAEQFFTGITVVDTLLPIGKGQRELIFGEPRSGKSPFMYNIIANQKGEDKICVYASIGKADIDLKRFIDKLKTVGAMEYTIILSATSSNPTPVISIAPAVALSIAEYFSNQGRDVLLILDDLSSHSKYLREICLLSGQSPGRESYPPDIFYQHGHLVERAGMFNKHKGDGSITLLPVIETDMENFTTLIPTNIMGMTDGHILFSATLNASGQYPAIEVNRSVTRAGRQTQFLLHKILSDKIRRLLTNYHELERYGRFGAELTPETQLTIKRGKIATELLKQEPSDKIEPEIQILLLSLIFSSFFDKYDIEHIKTTKKKLIELLRTAATFKDIAKSIRDMDYETLIQKLKQQEKVLKKICHQ